VAVVVLGGGLAGLASAWALARRGHRVTLLEREPLLGRHASGRNAGLVRRVVLDPDVAAVGRRGAALLLAPPADLAPGPLYRVTGSILVAGGEDVARLVVAAREARAAGVACRVVPARQVADWLLGLAPGGDDVAVVTEEDGVADPGDLLEALRGACGRLGVAVRTALEARVARAAAGDVRVTTGDGVIAADVAVVAAGPWAAELARDVGATAVPLTSLRRHLFHTGPLVPAPARDAAWVWDISRGLYVRPEVPGLLLSACDEEPRPPEDARPADAAEEDLARVVAQAAPELAELPLARSWAGLRTFAPDRRFVIGRDPLAPGLVWAAGLGGHGLTASLAVGELVARAVEGRDDPLLAALGPGRFAAARLTDPIAS